MYVYILANTLIGQLFTYNIGNGPKNLLLFWLHVAHPCVSVSLSNDAQHHHIFFLMGVLLHLQSICGLAQLDKYQYLPSADYPGEMK